MKVFKFLCLMVIVIYSLTGCATLSETFGKNSLNVYNTIEEAESWGNHNYYRPKNKIFSFSDEDIQQIQSIELISETSS